MSREKVYLSKEKVYFQPRRWRDGVVSHHEIPEELLPHEAFASKEDCERWLDEHNYDQSKWVIVRFCDDEEVEIINVNNDEYFSEYLYRLIRGEIDADEFRNKFGWDTDYDALNGIINVGNNTIITNEN